MKKFVFRTTRRITERGKKNCSCVKRLTSGVDHPLADRPRRGTVERGGVKKAAASTSKGGTKKKGQDSRTRSSILPPSLPIRLPGKRIASFRILRSRVSIPTHAYTRRAYLSPRAWKPSGQPSLSNRLIARFACIGPADEPRR